MMLRCVRLSRAADHTPPQPIRLNSIKLNDIFSISVHKFLDFKFTFV